MGNVGRFVTKRILFLNMGGDMQAVMWALKDAPDRGGNARGKTSERFHFYSPTSAAGARGVVIIPLHISTSKRLHKSPANISGRWNISDVQIHSTHTTTPLHISTSKRLHKSPANISGRWNIYDVQIHSTHTTTPRAPSADVGL